MNRFPFKKNAGVTVIEVLFAAGIAVFGLIGIASLIGVAGRQASQANEVAEAQALSNSWYADFVTRGLNDSSQWRWFNDQLGGAYATKFVPFANGGSPGSMTSTPSVRTAFRHAVCIDPTFYADATNIIAMSPPNTFGPAQAYRPGLFPYYQDNFDPLTSPMATIDFPTHPNFVNADLPRLLRVSLASSVAAGIMSETLVEQIFQSHDDLDPVQDEDDKTLPAIRFIGMGGSKLLSKGEYNWFATLSPREFASTLEFSNTSQEKLYTLDVVVVHRRDRQFFVPSSGGVENIPQGERLLAVTPTTSFTGGSGGRVIISASIEVSDKIRIGDWVMLARHQDASMSRSTVVRWYRVIGLDAEPTLTSTTWSRNVILDGPDWVFSAANPTQATLVPNVVTVLERVIPVY